MFVVKLLFRLFVMALFLSPVVLPLLVIQREPLVDQSEGTIFDDMGEAKAVLKRFDPRLMSAVRETKITVHSTEISRALGAAFARFSGVRGRVEARGDEIALAGTALLPLPDTILGRYLNVEAVIAESDSELVVTELSVGALPIPSFIIKPVAIYALDWFLGAGKGAPTYASIRSVAVDGQNITVAFQPPVSLVADVKAAAGAALHLGNADAVRTYYRVIADISRSQTAGPVSLAAYMGPLFALAEQRSQTGSPVLENRAAILALALYFGDSRFELLLRDVKVATIDDGDFDPSDVKLERRHDWVQHFVTTAAIQVAAGSGISHLIGEAKEVNDADGPSGFSFTDLAADRAGVRFAEVATKSEAGARRLQHALAKGVAESDFFPRVADFPEGLSESAFKTAYGDVGSPTYDALVAQIDRRIAQIELYR